MEDWMTCLYAFVGCGAFCFIFEMRRWIFILCAAGIGMVARAVCLLLSDMGGISQLVLATVVTATLVEIFARVLKTPTSVLLVIGVIPLVPGGGIYYAMEYCIQGEMDLFLDTTAHTLAIAGALALGILLVSSAVRLWSLARERHPK